MNIVDAIADAARENGFRAVYRDYEFADVFHPDSPTRRVPLAAFAQTPPSYRSAAIAVVYNDQRDPFDLVADHRALGAPLLFVVDGERISVWQLRWEAPARTITSITANQLSSLFKQNESEWAPASILRAKSIGPLDSPYQLDFVDAGLLSAIEGEIHTKLDRLLREALLAARDAAKGRKIDDRMLFQVVFRLISAKILVDRRHPFAEDWDTDNIELVLGAIESYYGLSTVPLSTGKTHQAPISAVWSHLRGGINFCNISADDLAFVYENTLVTSETRRHFGTHSTPRQVAEYVVRHLELWRHEPNTLSIYEPFAGAAVFLISALRHISAMLPIDWDERKRHNFLVQHLSGDEIDSFAREVANLSLILADYPNENGWRINEVDLFADDLLTERMKRNNVILCNPPFESFRPDERDRYPAAARTHAKPVAVLDAALEAKPLALGFVLPRPFILEKQYTEQRRRIEQTFNHVELVELPEGTFKVSQIEAALLIARDPRIRKGRASITLRSTEIADRDRNRFLKSGEVTARRELNRPIGGQPVDNLWIPALLPLWQYLAGYPRMGDLVTIHRGIEWQYPQDQAISSKRQSGYRRGLHTARNMKQFVCGEPVWLDCNIETLRGGAINFPWHLPKIIANAARLSRGAWRFASAVDVDGLICSQQYFGIWPLPATSEVELPALAAALNGPVANAYLALHSPAKRFRIRTLNQVPIPTELPSSLSDMVKEYIAIIASQEVLDPQMDDLPRLLAGIDAAVLQAYDLPPRLERQLFDYFRDAKRPLHHPWQHWDTAYPAPGLRLAERLSGHFNATGNWIEKVFQPLPNDEASILRVYGE